jgi:hypothetical protein
MMLMMAAFPIPFSAPPSKESSMEITVILPSLRACIWASKSAFDREAVLRSILESVVAEHMT